VGRPPSLTIAGVPETAYPGVPRALKDMHGVVSSNPSGSRLKRLKGYAMRLLGFRTSYGYDAAGGQVSATDALGNISSTVFDANRRTVASG
jgi:hypothetical protein